MQWCYIIRIGLLEREVHLLRMRFYCVLMCVVAREVWDFVDLAMTWHAHNEISMMEGVD